MIKMNKLNGRIRNGIACLGLAYIVHGGLTLCIHPYSDFDAPSRLVDRNRRVVEETLQDKKMLLEDYHQHFSEKGIKFVEEEISNTQVQLDSLAAKRDSLKKYEDEIVWRRISKPWTYLTDRF